MKFEESSRLKKLPPYLFAEIDKKIQKKKRNGIDVISLGIGDPDIPTPEGIIKELQKEAENPVNHQYPSSYGMDGFKEAVADYYKERFGVSLDPSTEVVTLSGAKEGIANIAYTYIDNGDYVLVPDPSYPVYDIGTMFAGGKTHTMPMEEENGYIIDLDSIDKDIAKKSKLMHINYPNNPTSAVCGLDFFEKVVDFASSNNIIVCHDNAYADTFFGDDKPHSFLSADGAKDVGIEFYSLSKTFNMTGWRIGCAVGNKEVIASLGKYKTNVDSGVFNAVQYAAIEAMKNREEYSKANNLIYKKRREMTTSILDRIGIDYYKSNATIYVWAKVPEGHTSESFAKLVLDKADVVVTPGSAYGKQGEGYFRISLTIDDKRLEEALNRIDKAL
jgi:LL-diaminopimelate aminotransferase